MEEEYLTLDKEYLEAYNIGYALSQGTGLKAETLDKLNPEQLVKLNINKSRLEPIKQGMKQYEKDKSLSLSKNRKKEVKIQAKEKSKVQSKDKAMKEALEKIKREQEENEQNKNKGFSR